MMDENIFHPAKPENIDYFFKFGELVNKGNLLKAVFILAFSFLFLMSMSAAFASDANQNGYSPQNDGYNNNYHPNNTTGPSDICVEKSVIPVDYKKEVTFTVSVSNKGKHKMTGIKIKDKLPEGIIYTWSDPKQGTYDESTGIWNLGSLNAGQTTWMHLSGIVNKTGTFTNTATLICHDQVDTNPCNNIAKASFTVKPRADIAVTKEFTNGTEEFNVSQIPITTANYGSNVWAVVKVTNNGPDAVSKVLITDTLPAGLVYLSHVIFNGTDYIVNGTAFNATSGIWTITNMSSGSVYYLALSCLVNQTGNLTNIANKTCSSLCDPNRCNDNASANLTVPPAADLGLTKSVDKTTVYVGDTLNFTLILQNYGPDTATSINVTDILPDGVSFVSYTANYGTYDNLTGIWSIDSLPTNTIAQLVITAIADTPGTKINEASVTSLTYDPILDNNNATASFDVLELEAAGGGDEETPGSGNSANAASTVSSEEVNMQDTGVPLWPALLAFLLVIAGTMRSRKR